MSRPRCSFSRASFLFRIAMLVAVVWQCSSCSKPMAPTPEDYLPQKQFKVVASTVHLAELAKELGGDVVSVECLLAPTQTMPKTANATEEPVPWNPNPFQFQARASDVFAMQTAHLVILNGLGLEKSLEAKIPEMRKQGVVVVVVGDIIPKEEIIPLRVKPDQPDPCIWNSPRMWKYAVQAITKGLTELVPPEAAPYFENRAHPVTDRMDRHMKWAEEKMANFNPRGNRYLLTTHDTLQYFSRDFGIETLAILSADGIQIPLQEVALREWMAKNRVTDFIPDRLANFEMVEEVSVKLELLKSNVIHSIMPARPGTKELGLLESFDVGTYDGCFGHLIRVVERRLGGKPKSPPIVIDPTLKQESVPAEAKPAAEPEPEPTPATELK